MREVAPRQLKFEDDAFKTELKKTVRVAKPMLTGSEQITFINEEVKKEIPSLRIIKKRENNDTIIRVPTQESHHAQFTDVIIEQDAILKIHRLKKNPRKFIYLNRTNLLVRSRKHRSNYWILKEGLLIIINPINVPREMRGKPQKISDISDFSEKNILRLRQGLKLSF